jgi:hypothetical protein
MNMDHDFYSLFSAYWWLLVPLFWAIFRLIRLFLEHKRATQALELIKTYTDQGKEIPPDLLQVLRPATIFASLSQGRSAREKARGLLIPGFIFVALAAAFSVLIIGRIAGDEREAYVGMTFVVVLLLGFAAAFFITSYFYHQDAKRLDPP